MKNEKFQQVENRYQELKSQREGGEISVAQLKQALKKLMIVDDRGHYWMIGGKTGRWYRHDGGQWIVDDPASLTQPLESPVPTPEVRLNPSAEKSGVSTMPREQTANCRVCDAVIPAEAEYCPACGANQNEIAQVRTTPHTDFGRSGETVLQLRSIRPFSMLFLLGGFGLILGVVLGASFGIFNILGDLIYQFPRMLQETRGKVQGGLIFGVLGGITGFITFALGALVVSGIYNILAELFGGIRFRVRQ